MKLSDFIDLDVLSVIDQIPAEVRTIVLIMGSLWILWKTRGFVVARLTKDTVTALIRHKERIFYPGKMKSMYLVYTDKEVFRNQDSLYYWSFNSSDVYRDLEVGQLYQLTVYGFTWRGKRVKWLSDYRNIIKVTNLELE